MKKYPVIFLLIIVFSIGIVSGVEITKEEWTSISYQAWLFLIERCKTIDCTSRDTMDILPNVFGTSTDFFIQTNEAFSRGIRVLDVDQNELDLLRALLGIKQSCQDKMDMQCYMGDVYWYDSCGQRQDLKERCPSYCSKGECKSSLEAGDSCTAESVCPSGLVCKRDFSQTAFVYGSCCIDSACSAYGNCYPHDSVMLSNEKESWKCNSGTWSRASCSDCGSGLMNICDMEECHGLGFCRFNEGYLINKCEKIDALGVTRYITKSRVRTGETFELHLIANPGLKTGFLLLEEQIPTGFIVISPSIGQDNVFRAGDLIDVQPNRHRILLKAPTKTGDYAFKGYYAMEPMSVKAAIAGDLILEVR